MKKEKSITLFIVDDNKIISLALENMFKETFDEYETSISRFETGEECLSRLNDVIPDVIILDYHLTTNILGMDGISVLKKIKQVDKNIEVVMLSGEDKLEIAVECIKYGARDYVIKNDSSFVRINQIVQNIAEHINVKTNLKKYTIWNWVFFGLIATFVIGEIIYLACYKYFLK